MKTEISQTALGLLAKGGWLMWPLALLSVVAAYVLVERLLTYRTQLRVTKSFLAELEDQLQRGDLHQLQAFCAPGANVVQKVLLQAIAAQRQFAAKSLECLLEGVSRKHVALLEERLALLATVAGVAPMIGFLGTVTGMIQTFMAIARENGQAATQLFSSGIYEAMVTTMAGLVVGIVAYVGYNYCVARVARATDQLSYVLHLFAARWVLP